MKADQIRELARADLQAKGIRIVVEKDGTRTPHYFHTEAGRESFRTRHANAVKSGRYDAIGGVGIIVEG